MKVEWKVTMKEINGSFPWDFGIICNGDVRYETRNEINAMKYTYTDYDCTYHTCLLYSPFYSIILERSGFTSIKILCIIDQWYIGVILIAEQYDPQEIDIKCRSSLIHP
jgi:hypothetical protein